MKINLKKPTKPAMKRPALSRPEAPQFFENLYRDLRDRRLLLPLAALLVALVAVPMLIKQGGEEPAPPPPASELSTAETTAVEPAVLAEQDGIRNYKQRLKDLKQKDPFAPAFKPKQPKEPKVDVADGSSTGSTDASSSAATTASASSSSSSSTSSVDTSSVTPVDDDVSSVDDPSTEEIVDGDGHRAEVIRFFSAAIDVSIGEPGHREQVEDVRYLDHLPGKATPLLTFLGFGGDTHEAVFAVGRNVTDHSGDGSCAPKKPAPCEFLTMKIGDTEKLVYGNQAKAFTIKLLDARVVEVDDPRKG